MCFCLCVPGGEDVPTAVPLAVHPIGGGVAVRTETKGEATAHIGHAAGRGGKAASDSHTHTQNESSVLVLNTK